MVGYFNLFEIQAEGRNSSIVDAAGPGLFVGIQSSPATSQVCRLNRLVHRKVVDLLNAMPERHRFVRGLRSWVGFRQIGLKYERRARVAGKVKYTVGKLFNLAVDGIVSFSTIPLRMATYFGFFVSLIALIGAIFTFVQRIFAEQFAQIGLGPVPGFATTVIAILFLGGVQLICLGIIGEYLGRIYDEVKGRPLWTIQNMLGAVQQKTE